VIGTRILAYDKISSTNELLKSSKLSLPSGSVVWALEQTSGRGRFGRYWHSPKGGLWFSVLFKHRTRSVQLHYYVILFSVTIVKFLQKLKIEAKVKWPNDIYAKNRKLAGVLAEGKTRGESAEIIVGVGMNVNNEIPPELREKAVNLKELVGHEMSLATVLDEVISQANSLYLRYMVKDKQRYLVRIWKRHQLFTPGSKLRVRVGLEEEKEAVLIDVEPNMLVLDFGRGPEKCTSVEVVHWEVAA